MHACDFPACKQTNARGAADVERAFKGAHTDVVILQNGTQG